MAVGGVIVVGKGAVAAGDGLNQVTIGIGVGILGQAGGGYRHQIAICIIAHGLSDLSQQRDVVKEARICVALIGQGDTNLCYSAGGFLGHNGGAGKLPLIADVGVEGNIVPFGGAIRIGDGRPKAAFLGHIVRTVQLTGVIRDSVGLGPAGENIGLGSRQIQRDVLVGIGAALLRVTHNSQAVAGIGNTHIGGKAGVGSHGPAVAYHFHAAVFHQVEGGRPLSLFQLKVVGIERSNALIVIHTASVHAAVLGGKAYADSYPAAVNGWISGITHTLADILITLAVINPNEDATFDKAGNGGGIHEAGEGIGLSGYQFLCLVVGRLGDCFGGRSLNSLCAGAGFFRGNGDSRRHRPRIFSGFHAGIFQQLLSRNANGGRALRAVVFPVGPTVVGIHSVGRSQDIAVAISGVCIGRPPGIVEQIIGQNIICRVCGTIRTIIPVDCLCVVGINYGDGSTGRRATLLLVGGNFTGGIGEGDPVATLAVSHFCQAVSAVLIGGNSGAASLNGHQIGAGIVQGIHIPGIVGHTGKRVAVIGKAGHGQRVLTVIELGNGRDLSIAVVDVEHVPIRILRGGEVISGEDPLVPLVVGHGIGIGAGVLDFQAKAILIVIEGSVLRAVLAEIMDGSISVCVFQVGHTGNGLRGDLLDTVQRPSGTDRHVQPQLRQRIVICRRAREVVGVVDQIQGEGVGIGSIAYQLLNDLQLAGSVCHIGSARLPCPHGPVGVVGLDAGVVTVRDRQDGGNGTRIGIEGGRGEIVVCIDFVLVHHGQRNGGIVRAIRVPLFHQFSQIPVQVLLAGLTEGKVNGIGGIVAGLVPPPGHLGEPVVVAAIAAGQAGGDFVGTDGELRAVALGIGGLVQAQIRMDHFGTRGDAGHILEVHVDPVAAIIGSAVGLSAHIQPLAAKGGVIGSCLHGINGVNVLQGLTGDHGQGRIDIHRKFPVFPVDPPLVRFHGEDISSGILSQGEGNPLGVDTGGIHHIGRGNFIMGDPLFIQEGDGTVLIQNSFQAVRFQQEVKTVRILGLVDHDLLLDVIAESGIQQVDSGEHIPVHQRGLELLGDNILNIPDIFLLELEHGWDLVRNCGLNAAVKHPGRRGNSRLGLFLGPCLHADLAGSHVYRLNRIQQGHGHREVSLGGSKDVTAGQILGKGGGSTLVCGFQGVRFQQQAVVNILPLAVAVLIMDGHTVGNRDKASVRQAEMFDFFFS